MKTKRSYLAVSQIIGLMAAVGLLVLWTAAGITASAEQPDDRAPFSVDNLSIASVNLSAGSNPDAYGYVYSDSLTVGGPAYNWLDVAASGAVLSFGNPDEGMAYVTLPLTFTFYGQSYTSLYAATNGYATFRNTAVVSQCLPANQQPPNTLAAFCADLNVGNSVYYSTTTAYNGRQTLIIQYDNVTHTLSGLTATFQIILDAADNSIVYQYRAMPAFTVTTATIGINGYATNQRDYLTYCQGTAGCPPQNGLAVRFALSARPLLGVQIASSNDFPVAGQVITYTITLSNTGGAVADGASMSNVLPVGLNYVSDSAQSTADAVSYNSANHTLRWDGNLAVSGAVTVTYAATLSTTNPIYNTAVLTHPQALQPAGATSSPADSWSAPQLLDSALKFDGTLGSWRYLAMDRQGAPRLAFAGPTGLYYATLSDTVWLSETVPITLSNLANAALALDGEDRAQIAFYGDAGDLHGLWLARQISLTDQLTWTVENIVTFTTWDSPRPDLWQSADGRLHLAYDFDNSLYYAVRDNVAWLGPTLVITQQACTANSWSGFSLAVDQDNAPHLACMHNDSSTKPWDVRVYTYSATAPWTAFEVVTSSNSTMHYYPSLAFDGNTPHLAFFRGLDPYHATRSGNWTLTRIATFPPGHWTKSATLGIGGGQVHVGYVMYQGSSPTYTPTVRLASRPLADTVWVTQTVDGPYVMSNADPPPATLAVDGMGRAHLAYYHGGEQTIRYARPISAVLQTVAVSRNIGNAALAVGSDGSTHVAYLSQGLRYSVSPTGVLWSKVLAMPGVSDSSQTNLDMALDAANTPHVAYGTTNQPLYHATLSNSLWITRLIDTPGNMATQPSVGGGVTGTAHVAYTAQEGGNLALRYAAFDGSTWSTQTLTILGPNAFSQSPKLLAQGDKVHILYADCSAYQPSGEYPIGLKLATLQGGSWSTQTLYELAGQCANLSFQLLGDSQGRLAARLGAVSSALRPSPLDITLWLAEGGLVLDAQSARPARSESAQRLAPQMPLMPAGGRDYSYYSYKYGIRGDGKEKITISDGDKYASYTDRDGYGSSTTYLNHSLDTSTYIVDQARYGSMAAALEYSYRQNALAIEILFPPGHPAPPEADAVKQATPRFPQGVYATERISYETTLRWKGEPDASIVFNDPIPWPSLGYIPGTLRWGAYIPPIVGCAYQDVNHTIGCGGMFPASTQWLQTFVSFVVTATCDIYDFSGGMLRNTASANIDGFNFTPMAETAKKTPFKLRASSPSFLPSNVFTPEHTLLLYTVPKGDEPDTLWQQCNFDLYVVVNDDANHPVRLTNNGSGLASRANADFNANDLHYSAWFTPTSTSTQTLDLYVVSAGMGLTVATWADTLIVPPNPSPRLVALTDLRELFQEFEQITPGSAIADANRNRSLDYYDAIERVRQYASDHQGVVLDARQDAYTQDYDYYANSASRSAMGIDLNENLVNYFGGLPGKPQHLAIIGDDAVLPFFRLESPNGGFDERNYLAGQANGNPTLMDSQSGAAKGILMTDVPYGTFTSTLACYPQPNMGVGRVLYDAPLALVEAIAAYEQPIDLRAAQSTVALPHLANEGAGGIRWSDLVDAAFIPKLSSYYGAANLDRHVPLAMPLNFQDGHVYVYDAAASAWNAVTTTRRAAGNSDLIILQTHADHRTFSAASGRDIDATDFASATVDLVLTTACHAGYSTAYRQNNAAHPYYLNSLARSLLNRHTAYFASTTYGMSPSDSDAVRWHRRIVKDFLRWATGPMRLTTGQTHLAALLTYEATGDTTANLEADAYALYAMHLYGLPTQPILNQAEPITPSVLSLEAAPRRLLSALSTASFTATESVSITNFAASFDTAGRAVFDIPAQGGRFAETFGPLLPAVRRTYPLPQEAANLVVTLVSSASHTYATPVDLQTMGLASESFGPVTGSFAGANPYPSTLLRTHLFEGLGGQFLYLIALPMQYDSSTRQASLYDNLTYRITYDGPNTVTVSGLLVNDGNPVAAGGSAAPVSLTLNSLIAFDGNLIWSVEDGRGDVLADGGGALSLTAGSSVVGWNMAVSDWAPGAKHLWVALLNAEGKIIASGWTDLMATGQSLAAETDREIYTAAHSAAEVRATVRDQNGAGVGGQGGDLSLWLNGSQSAAIWQAAGDGVYTTTISLGALPSSVQFFSVTLGALTRQSAFQVDRNPPTSLASSPPLVYSPTFTVSLSGSDDVSGLGYFRVQYRVGATGAWTDWLTRTANWDYGAGDFADLTPAFGPTQPVIPQPGNTYYFRAQAVDVAGNQETLHATADTATTFYGGSKIYLPLVLRI